ncbi:MAG: orotidine-5'-phosphate decarboxylase [Bacteroidia bacterium]|nr:orotidine-5'-phosphate decarboxylase [Bacteroidia bacterium]
MTKAQLIQNIKTKKTMLCVGLDVDMDKIPQHLLQTEDPIFEFNKAIIDATHPYCVAYKPNTAFYECYGSKGFASLEKTVNYIKTTYPNQFVIIDAKRGDIGNTATMYAKAYLQNMPGDAITVAPYMGEDSVKPFMQLPNKWAVVLGLTSNTGAQDFQKLPLPKFNAQGKIEVELLCEVLMRKVATWGTTENTMFVVGATQGVLIKAIRQTIPNHFLLIPGVGAQGGNLQEVIQNGSIPNEYGLLINSSRSIIYASNGADYAQAAGIEAQKLQQEMSVYI